MREGREEKRDGERREQGYLREGKGGREMERGMGGGGMFERGSEREGEKEGGRERGR